MRNRGSSTGGVSRGDSVSAGGRGLAVSLGHLCSGQTFTYLALQTSTCFHVRLSVFIFSEKLIQP